MWFKISIIIPIFNVETFIGQCLESVICQTYKDPIECLLIDDCGTDNSIELAQNMIKNYTGNISFRIIKHYKNRGLSAARNTGLLNARGKYVYFLDSDDWLYPDCIRQLIEMTQIYPDAQMVQAFAIKGCKNFLEDKNIKEMPEYLDNKAEIKNLLLNGGISIMEAWNKLISRDFLLSNKLFFQEGIVNEDLLWKFYLAKHLSSMCICKSNTYYYRIREGSIMSRPFSTRWPSLKSVYLEMMDNIDDFCRGAQIYCIGKQLHELYYALEENSYKGQIVQLMKTLASSSPIFMKMKLYLFVTFHDSNIRNFRLGESLFYRTTVFR